MTDILDEFRLAIPANRRTTPSGWVNFCCPACGDKRYRGGFNTTPSGGFRYYCFNGGCEYNIKPTGWEPGNGFGGRPRRLFEMLGGDIKRIPLQEIMKWNTQRFTPTGEADGEEEQLDVVWKFPEVSLPPNSQPLLNVYQSETAANKVMEYAVRRVGTFVKNLPFYWSPEHPYFLLIPYLHYGNKVIGWLGRHIYRKSGPKRFIQHAPSDYVFNQHLISAYSARYLFVVESPLDAMLLGCVAVRNDRMTERQENLLKVSGKDIVLVPDLKQGESGGFLEIAERNQWFVSIPDFAGTTAKAHRKSDLADSVVSNGLLYTIEAVMGGTTRNFKRARIELSRLSA